MEKSGVLPGAPVFLRIFKQERELQLFMQNAAGDFEHVRSWPICAVSGRIGPKLREGDRQAPEGFYAVSPRALNPASSYHLSFNLGYPNAYDRAHGRTGSYLMVHGDCVSIGCYAMTDPVIEEIYAIMEAAFDEGQPFIRVHAFPFEMSDANLAARARSQWADFWTELKQGYDWFETHRRPPDVTVDDGVYRFGPD